MTRPPLAAPAPVRGPVRAPVLAPVLALALAPLAAAAQDDPLRVAMHYTQAQAAP